MPRIHVVLSSSKLEGSDFQKAGWQPWMLWTFLSLIHSGTLTKHLCSMIRLFRPQPRSNLTKMVMKKGEIAPVWGSWPSKLILTWRWSMWTTQAQMLLLKVQTILRLTWCRPPPPTSEEASSVPFVVAQDPLRMRSTDDALMMMALFPSFLLHFFFFFFVDWTIFWLFEFWNWKCY